MNFPDKSKLFRREKMQAIKLKDYPKVIVIIGIIVVPVIFGLII